MDSTTAQNNTAPSLPQYIPLSYNHADSQGSALRLVLALFPDWEHADGKIEFVRFTDGITNTLLKIIRRAPGLSEEQIDNEAVLMRAYGNNTEIIIDRQREARSHALLASRGLAPPLLARFKNGLLYRFIQGQVTSPNDLIQPRVWRGVARRLAEWHAVLPIDEVADSTGGQEQLQDAAVGSVDVADPFSKQAARADDIIPITTRQAGPNLWTVLQKWILALPVTTEKERERRRKLQQEFQWIVAELYDESGLGKNGLVFAHCDLLSANVIIQPKSTTTLATEAKDGVETVSFIDYEYATPSPAAFDIANNFAEWGGYDCDYNMLPTRSVRKAFLEEYVQSYYKHSSSSATGNQEEVVSKLCLDVDLFRGIPGFYWGVWALIQATISQIDFDYASYAEARLGEYWAWKHEVDGSRAQSGAEMPLRERRWAQEA
ncbi:hypothetical protein AJ80_03205 [Polytolypa hystricis UAMH7299]|uniref:ethanolamine kinase n=1 Tax=Polytolypa hystricis (strain UAMH7299) TaxID=1447883 RepID=A0A2B7YLP1_POLH7|nr:hypothetical protein AJ80_03205 [Polytolypa hystricis UAMH7299]